MLPDRGKRGTGKGPVAGGAVEHLRNWKKPVWLEQKGQRDHKKRSPMR